MLRLRRSSESRSLFRRLLSVQQHTELDPNTQTVKNVYSGNKDMINVATAVSKASIIGPVESAILLAFAYAGLAAESRLTSCRNDVMTAFQARSTIDSCSASMIMA